MTLTDPRGRVLTLTDQAASLYFCNISLCILQKIIFSTSDSFITDSLNNLSAFSLDHLSVSSRHTRASNENKLVSLPVRTDYWRRQIFIFSSDHYWLEFPPIGCSSLAVDSSPSTGLCRTRHPPTVADHRDTPAVMGGMHPLLDIALKNHGAL